MELGKVNKIQDLRSVWKNEPRNFSKWLAEDENLKMLGDAINVDMTLDELESKVGGFSVDLLATENGTSRKIIIENQLEDTDHLHLGQIITYASGKDAKIVIWLVKKAREEHKKAIEWLNDQTRDVSFFLVEIELWQIDNSPIAPHFNVVEMPNDWAKTIGGLSDSDKIRYEFWQSFSRYAFDNPEFKKEFSQRKPYPQNWYSLGISNKSYTVNVGANITQKIIYVCLYIPGDKDFFDKLKKSKEEFEQKFGCSLEWKEASKDCRIVANKKADIKTETDNNWKALFKWLMEMSLKMKKVTLEFDK
ncbi:DUF4268 domain-containing protein [Mycoplasma sp. T193]|uniref:DUF4268 domain-containing protein n=1 Tax=Mycoplasma sp. T193 TaxID=3401666 RepID=UPI003AAFD293